MGRSQIWTVTIRGKAATVEELLEHEERPRASYVPAELAAVVAAPTRGELTALYTFLTGRPWLHRSRSVRAMSSPIRPTPPDVDSSAAVVLQHYAEQYCEGMCLNDPELARFDGECGGCLARRTAHQIEVARQDQEAQR